MSLYFKKSVGGQTEKLSEILNYILKREKEKIEDFIQKLQPKKIILYIK